MAIGITLMQLFESGAVLVVDAADAADAAAWSKALEQAAADAELYATLEWLRREDSGVAS